MKKFNLIFLFLSALLLSFLTAGDVTDTSASAEIPVQNLTMKLKPGKQIFNEALLAGEIADTEVNHIILAGPYNHSESLSESYDTILLFIKGTGTLNAADQSFQLKPESIALPMALSSVTIDVSENDTLHYVKIRKKLSQQDLQDLKNFPAENRNTLYFRHFDECQAYTEKIKSPNTVSRTVLPKDFVPRVAMGTVQTIGPDAVGAHEHPMLDQLFLGLAGNDVIVHADDKQVEFKEFALLHIPIGSSHWVTVKEGKSMYYQWMDFFLTKKGEEWLKTHKHVDDYEKK